MDGDTLVLACTEEDWDYANDLAENLSQNGMNIFRVEYDVSDLAGPGLFQWLDDLAGGESSCNIMLLLPHHYVTNQANSTEYSTERYIFRISFDDSDTPASPPWILCIRQPDPYLPNPPSTRASSKSKADSHDEFKKTGRSKGIPGWLSVKKDKSANKPNRQSKTRPYVTVWREFEEKIRFGEANPAAYSDLGYGLWCLEKYDEAYQAYANAIRCDPDYAAAYNGLGSTCWCLEKYDEALQYYEKSARLAQPAE